MREQRTPTPERVEIGTRFITILVPGGPAEIWPIPNELAPLVATLRAIAAGKLAEVALDAALTTEPTGWRITWNAADTAVELTLQGCGAELRAFTVAGADGMRRRLVFALNGG